ncbi:ABC transporter permease subunit [Geodermatophilus sabuli]|uniref:ABC-type transport system involved in multi-copper enzyme maturation, permease component n=1 Tax=Geodermatophilus sabuli TaxID=1564158 RepID=A0A285E889_9ACTN|nr:ABC transporter permease subunit [Geodermatophilus sabuli]MBB3082700.1 ABC-type transport system involved in multi-copper enzyme maturation permease subunit [Geodermatophilus sabuli]SNX94434.1 ABC-type transport system involved in multi-copper enzyme maturation, permease component [Geodermatophilus sabuli]
MTALTVAGLTVREAARRRVVWALLVLTVVLLALSAWGFSKLIGLDTELGTMTSGEARLVASLLLNLIMFGYSLIAAIGTAFLAGPTVAGEVESGQALALLARPVRRSAVLFGKWLGLVAFGCGYVVLAGLAQILVVRTVVGYWPPAPVAGLALLAAETIVLLTLALLLSSVVSTMASGIVAVGLFGATWVAGVVGGLGAALGNEGVARVGTVSRVLLPTDGLWRGAMNAFQDPVALVQMGPGEGGFPFLSDAPLTPAYLAWAVVWVAVVWGLTALSFQRRDV